MGSLWRELRRELRRRRTRAGRGGAERRGLGSGTATGRRNGPSALPLQNETAPDRLVRSPRLVQGRSMEPSREVEAWVESYCFLVSYWR